MFTLPLFPSHPRTQLDGRLLDQVESLKKDITRLEYQNNELERVCTFIILCNIT